MACFSVSCEAQSMPNRKIQAANLTVSIGIVLSNATSGAISISHGLFLISAVEFVLLVSAISLFRSGIKGVFSLHS